MKNTANAYINHCITTQEETIINRHSPILNPLL